MTPMSAILMQTLLIIGIWTSWQGSAAGGEGAGDANRDAATGSIRGTVVYRADSQRPWRYSRYYVKDRKAGHLAEAVVGIHDRQLKAPNATPQTVQIDQVNFQFVPETVAIRAGDTVKFTNSDNEVHSVLTNDVFNRFNTTVPKGQEYERTFRRGASFRPIQIGCAFHGGMRAWIFLFDHPYFDITKGDGRFELTGLPPGEYRLRMSHPAGKLAWNSDVRVQAGKTTTVQIIVTPDHLTENPRSK